MTVNETTSSSKVSLRRPLTGVRVLDLTRLLPGGLAARKLADLGADVVKVEHPGVGDTLRVLPPLVDGVGIAHRILGRGKRSIELDYTKPEGLATLYRLSDEADVVIEMSMPGRLAQYGFDIAELRRRNPKLVVCSVTGFGQTGPLAQLPSHGMVMDAAAGWVTIDRDERGKPKISDANFTSVAVEMCALGAALGVVAALRQAAETGEGAWIDASCWDHAVDGLRYRLSSQIAIGQDWVTPTTLGPTYAVYDTAKGFFLFCCMEEKFFTRFCDNVGRPDLKQYYVSIADGMAQSDALRTELEGVFMSAEAREWDRRFTEWKLPGTEVVDTFDLLDHPHFQARGLLDEQPASDPLVPMLDPLRWVDNDWRPGAGQPSSAGLGEHTEEVLEEWLSGENNHALS